MGKFRRLFVYFRRFHSKIQIFKLKKGKRRYCARDSNPEGQRMVGADGSTEPISSETLLKSKQSNRFYTDFILII